MYVCVRVCVCVQWQMGNSLRCIFYTRIKGIYIYILARVCGVLMFTSRWNSTCKLFILLTRPSPFVRTVRVCTESSTNILEFRGHDNNTYRIIYTTVSSFGTDDDDNDNAHDFRSVKRINSGTHTHAHVLYIIIKYIYNLLAYPSRSRFAIHTRVVVTILLPILCSDKPSVGF